MTAPTPEISLKWSSRFRVGDKINKIIPGDKIILPQTALEQLLAASTVTATSNTRPANPAFDPFNPYSLAAARAEQSEWRDTQQQLPHPLTFRLVNAKNGNVVYAGIQEFSAVEGEVELSPFLLEALGISIVLPKPRLQSVSIPIDDSGSLDQPIEITDDDDEIPQVTVHAQQLPKGTYARLRPLEAGYNPEDWKALLERHMRENFTTLTTGGILAVRGSKSEQFRFLIDKVVPDGDGICVVDTDLEVDIEALNEEQARETLKQIMKKAQKAPGSSEGTSAGGDLNIWKPAIGQVLDGDYVDYQLTSWDHSQAVDIELSTDDGEDLQLFISLFSPRQRVKPRDDEHVLGDFSTQATKRIIIQPSNIELENAEALFVSIHASSISDNKTPRLHRFSLRSQSIPKANGLGLPYNPTAIDEDKKLHGPDEEQCKNCHQWVPKRTMMLHENFCLRNNICCPHCSNVFQKKSLEWENHWHCPYDSEYGSTSLGKSMHDGIYHTPRQCPSCPYEASSLRDLAVHRTSVCPGKLILCQFCHLEVPQEGDPFNPSPESLLSGLTAHELADGARTTDCHLCSKIVRLRDMATHLRHHELEKSTRSKPEICRNSNCGRTLHGVGKNGDIGAASRMGQGPGNDLGLCSICFGPLYVSMHDPEGKALKRRVERRYLAQLIKGCGQASCTNEYCKTAKAKDGKGSVALSTQEALPMVKPLMESYSDRASPMYFCVDGSSQKRRKLAEMMASEKSFDLEWCVAACEVEGGNLDAARQWLQNWAPRR